MKILFVHQEKKFRYGAHYINDLIIEKLRKKRHTVDTVYPKESINLFSRSLSGINNILFFYSLINKKKKANKYDIIQGTTYTVLPFLDNGAKVISHFGSTTYGFLKKVPTLKKLESEKVGLSAIFSELKQELLVNNRSASIKSLQDISKIEIAVAKKSTAVIAASQKVKAELIKKGVYKHKIHLIHNAIEDYWFSTKPIKKVKPIADLVYLGRIGDDVFTIKLKGINRLLYVLKKFPEMDKIIIGMCSRIHEYYSLLSKFPHLTTYLSTEKRKIPSILKKHYGDIYINTGRYEGFCLSLVEAMSQGLIPITFPIGVAPEIIHNSKNGYVVNNIDEMIEKINLLKSNKEKREKMAKESMKTSLLFTPDILTDKLIKLYSTVK